MSVSPESAVRALRQASIACVPMMLWLLTAGCRGVDAVAHGLTPPNLVVIFIDDLGYADVGPFGSGARYDTPHIDALARAGRRFTDFQVSSAVCSASRAALLTGCYHLRVGFAGALGPNSEIGLRAEERTLAELCREHGYATACFGKWHLGHHPRFLPTRHGFDEYSGLPYSNDMWPFHPNLAKFPDMVTRRKRGYPDLPLVENERVVDADVTAADQATLTSRYTARAVDFIERQAAMRRPFFLYVPHTMVHVPLFVGAEFEGKSRSSLFADVMLEIDASVGAIVAALDRTGVGENTWVVFTSDNGPWLSYGDHAGSAHPLREGKGTAFEGGTRVPTIMRWPARIPAGTTCTELASTIDILPTMAALFGVAPTLRDDLPIDGRDIGPLLFGDPTATSPHESFWYYYGGGQLQAVRDRRFKLVLPHRYASLADPNVRAVGGTPVAYRNLDAPLALYDLHEDIGETRDVAHLHPDVVARLEAAAAEARADLGDTLRDLPGPGRRGPARLREGDERLRW